MRFRLRTLLTQFSIRDLIWLTLVVAGLTAWLHLRRENAVLRNDNAAKTETIEVKSQALAATAAAAAKKEAVLRRELELERQMRTMAKTIIDKRTAELEESLQRREEVLKALRTLNDEPAPSN